MSGSALLAILGMALATYATRVAGLFLVRGVAVKGRLKAALDALPPAILMAVIAPTILLTGNAERIAAILAAVSAFFRLPLIVTIIVGVVSVVVLRQFIA
jgi:branched chain amino acid efflux pump